MLYWGIFTTGFIIGGVFASYVFTGKGINSSGNKAKYPMQLDSLDKNNPDKLFEQITQINYPV